MTREEKKTVFRGGSRREDESRSKVLKGKRREEKLPSNSGSVTQASIDALIAVFHCRVNDNYQWKWQNLLKNLFA